MTPLSVIANIVLLEFPKESTLISRKINIFSRIALAMGQFFKQLNGLFALKMSQRQKFYPQITSRLN